MTKVERLLTRRQVREIVSLSLAEIDRREKAEPPRFPIRVRLSSNPRGRCAYVQSEIEEYVRQMIAQRAAAPK
jgi:predicted DNA-binding transcriptional regulator AlpA